MRCCRFDKQLSFRTTWTWKYGGELVSVLVVKGMHLRAASRHLVETQGCHRFDVPLCQ